MSSLAKPSDLEKGDFLSFIIFPCECPPVVFHFRPVKLHKCPTWQSSVFSLRPGVQAEEHMVLD